MKNKQMLATLVMLSLLQGSVYAANQNIVIENQSDYDKYKNEENNIILEGGNNIISISGVKNDNYEIIAGNAASNNVIITNSELGDITGTYSDSISVSNNIINIDNSAVSNILGASVYQYKDEINDYIPISAENNYVIVKNNSTIGNSVIGTMVWYGDASNNSVDISNIEFGDNVDEILGAYVCYGMANGNKLVLKNCQVQGYLCGGEVIYGSSINNIVEIKNIMPVSNDYINIYAGVSNGNFLDDTLNTFSDKPSVVRNNKKYIYGDNKINHIYAGYEESSPLPELVSVISNYVDIYGKVEAEQIVGGRSDAAKVIDNKIILYDGSKAKGTIVAAISEEKTTEVRENSINLQGSANVKNADLCGYGFGEDLEAVSGDKVSNNNLVIDKGWTGEAKSVQNFNNINFNNIVWQVGNDKAILTADNGNIKGSNFNLTLQNGQKVNVGESMLLFESKNDLGDIANDGSTFNTNLGVTTAVEGIVEQSADNKTVTATIKDVKLADQTKLVAENRAVAAAFINQGTDLIADSLDVLSRDGKYGVKTFAAVQGNRSKYDVNSDIKINGWSTIVGIGAENEHHGGDFSWGAFYENGSGNYRTFNEFNNEFFRGDGSLVYNGGGIAARYENKNGVYTEGSLRAGMLKSDMDNALRDGAGNFYGYESESAYYGAHLGIGKIISLSESSDLDVYGKFFHTYTEGDSFKVAGDEFEFDSINSDRLRIGARITSNKENKFSTYYGLAYEYEFNGDADMTAQGLKAPTQSLQGSSVMAEVGFNYQPTPTSPWSLELNMRGYTGERQGGSFNVQATYTF